MRIGKWKQNMAWELFEKPGFTITHNLLHRTQVLRCDLKNQMMSRHKQIGSMPGLLCVNVMYLSLLTCLYLGNLTYQSNVTSPKQQQCNLQWVKIECWEANVPHLWLSHSRGRVHMVKSLLFSSSPVLENMFAHSYSRNLFNTRTEDCAARGLTSLLMRAAEVGQEAKRKVRRKSGFIHVKCGPLYCSWKVESWCISGTHPKQCWRQFSILCHFPRHWFSHCDRLMVCNLMYTVVSVVRCILTLWNYSHVHLQ